MDVRKVTPGITESSPARVPIDPEACYFDVGSTGVYARSAQGRRVQPAATNRHSHISTRRWCISGLAVKQDAYDRSRDFPAQSSGGARALSLLTSRLVPIQSGTIWRFPLA